MLVVFVRRDALLLRDFLDRPKLAPTIIIDRNSERACSPNPPFRSIQRAFAFKGRATPSAKLGFPLFARQVRLADQLSVTGCHVIFGAGDKPCRGNYALIFQSFANAGKGTDLDAATKPMR